VTDAYRCDHCEEYKDGEPAEKLYTRHYPQKRTEHRHRADLCPGCSKEFAGGPPDETDA